MIHKQRCMMNSEYMQWSKKHAHVRYNLANSGLMNYPLSKLPFETRDLALTGDSYYGYEPLQEAIAKKCNVSKENVFSTVGTSLANHIAMAVLLRPGDEVLIEHPTYELLLSTALYLGASVKRFPRHVKNKFQIDPRDIEKTITKKTRLIIITNLHNPSSVFTDDYTLKQIGNIAKRNKAHVLVDEVYLDSAFDLRPRSSFHLGDEFIVTTSLTKVYGLSGLRCGWVLAKPSLIKKMWRLNDLFNVIPAHPAECLSVLAFKHLDSITDWVRYILEKNHRTLSQFLNTRQDISAVYPGFGTTVFPLLKNKKVGKLQKLLNKKYDTSITPGKFFEMPNYFRIGLGNSPELFETGLNRLGKALDELK
jgi:aspartate/methionine/tyrosine aminotransferase